MIKFLHDFELLFFPVLLGLIAAIASAYVIFKALDFLTEKFISAIDWMTRHE